jgi:DNA-binding NtrC family response regulator
MPDSVLLVDDDETQRQPLVEILEGWGFTVQEAASVEEATEKIHSRPPSVIITDLVMPGAGGLDLLRAIRPDYTGSVIVLSGRGTIEKAVEAIKEGAEDFVEKPVNFPKLRVLLDKIREKGEIIREIRRLREELARHGTFGPLRGSSPKMRDVYRLIEQVAPSNVSVLIVGESGTGKELVARTIHDMSPRRRGPFVGINCAAIPRELIESDLFGHEKGAFTGAIARKSGCFEMAHRGTLLLDEISEMDEALQAKLLRVLQEQSFRRIGGAETIHADVRVLAATNRDPRQAISERKLREDLYYRLNVVTIPLPPLRERVEDLPLLVQTFLDELTTQGEGTPTRIPAETLAVLQRHSWPGNVRELRNAIERAVVLGAGPELRPEHFPPDVLDGAAGPARSAGESPNGSATAESGDQFVVRLGVTVDDVQKELITRTLRHEGGNKTRAARILGLSLKTIHNKARKYGL